jgi:hypothetical protein
LADISSLLLLKSILIRFDMTEPRGLSKGALLVPWVPGTYIALSDVTSYDLSHSICSALKSKKVCIVGNLPSVCFFQRLDILYHFP